MDFCDDFDFITLSTDIFHFYPYYHDYHFCCIFKRDSLGVFEPKRGRTKQIGEREIRGILRSVEENLGDARIAFAI